MTPLNVQQKKIQLFSYAHDECSSDMKGGQLMSTNLNQATRIVLGLSQLQF
jgi:hypothetical protein